MSEWSITLPDEVVRQAVDLRGDRMAQLVPVASYATKPFAESFSNLQVIAPIIPIDTSNGADPSMSVDLTEYYGVKKRQTPEEESEMIAGDKTAFKAIKQVLGRDQLGYFAGEVVPSDQLQGLDPSLPLPFIPSSKSACLTRNRERALEGAAVAEHIKVAKEFDKWYDHSAIDKTRVSRVTELDRGAKVHVLLFQRKQPLRILK